MRTTRWLIGGLAVAAATAVLPVAAAADPGIGIGIVLTAHDSDGYRGSVREAFRHGFDNGRQAGAERGYQDGRHGRDFQVRLAYRNPDRGYRGWMGARGEYAAGYRQGFESAYRRSYASARPGWYDRLGRDDHADRYRNDRDRDREDPAWRR